VAVTAENSVVMRQAGYFYSSVGTAALARDIYDIPFSLLKINFYMKIFNFDLRK
jgi:hypothetical protein